MFVQVRHEQTRRTTSIVPGLPAAWVGRSARRASAWRRTRPPRPSGTRGSALPGWTQTVPGSILTSPAHTNTNVVIFHSNITATYLCNHECVCLCTFLFPLRVATCILTGSSLVLVSLTVPSENRISVLGVILPCTLDINTSHFTASCT